MEQSVSLSRTRRSRQQIEELLADFSKAGCTVKEFCETHQISKGAFHKWQSRLSNKSLPREDAEGFSKVVVSSVSSALFAEVNGIRIYRPVTASYLKELLP